MSNHSIPRELWSLFLDAFSREHEGSPVTVETRAPDSRQQVETCGLPLGGVIAEVKGSPGEILVIVGWRPGAHLTHRVTDPAGVTVEETDAGVARALRIVSRDGEETLVRLRAPVEGEIFFG